MCRFPTEVDLLDTLSVRRSSALEWLIGGLGIAVGLFEVPQFAEIPSLEILFLLGLGIVLELVPVPIGKAKGSLLYVVPLALVVAYSPAAAICVTIAASLIVPSIHKVKMIWSTRVFNSGQYGLSALAMTLVYRVVAGQGVGAAITVRVLAGLIVACLVFMAVNHGFVHLVLYVRGGFQITDVWSLLMVDGVNFFAAIPFAILFILASGPWPLWAPILMLPVLLVSQVFRMYRKSAILRDVHTALLRLTGELDVDTITLHAAATAARVTNADAVAIYMFDAAHNSLIPNMVFPTAAAKDFKLDGLARTDGGIIWAIVESGSFTYVPNTQKDSRVIDDGVGGRYYHSLAVYPLQTHGSSQGALVLYSLRPYSFDETDHELTRVLAGQVAVLLENAKLYQQLQEQSWRDAATGLYNYRYLYEELERRTNAARRLKRPLSVVIVDIDSFKKFNDTYGHLAGDAVLKSIAQFLQAMVGSDSVVARYGGEEFAMILPVSPDEAVAQMETIRMEVLHHVVNFQGYRLQGITVSSGVAGFPEHAIDDRDLLLKADSAMYWGAKQRGRNRTALYAPEFDTQLFVDELTGLYTYHFVNIRVRTEIEQGVRHWGVLCFDIDNLSFINETFGTEAGERVLRESSLILKEYLRTNELACRFDGDEFLVLLPGITDKELGAISGRLSSALHEQRFEFRSNVLIPAHIRWSSGAFVGVDEAGTLFEQVGRMFGELNALQVVGKSV